MKIIFVFLIFSILIALFSCNQVGKNNRAGYEIHGYISGKFDGTVYLGKEENGKMVYVDSSEINKSRFVLKNGHVAAPEVHYIVLNDKTVFIEFFLENAYIEAEIDVENQNQTSISGSETQNEYAEFKENNSVYENKQKHIYAQFEAAQNRGDSIESIRLDSLYKSVFNEQTGFIVKYVLANKTSHVSAFLAARTLAPIQETDELETLAANFSPDLHQSRYFKELMEEIENRRNSEPGNEAPEIALPDSTGIIYSLRNFRGRYVVLYYWASWNGESRITNKKLSELRTKFSPKKLEIVSVSIDETRNSWMNVVNTDKLPGIKLCSFQGAFAPEVTHLAVKQIPTSFLINPEGIIVVRDENIESITAILEKSLH